jgi:hypothetical protein
MKDPAPGFLRTAKCFHNFLEGDAMTDQYPLIPVRAELNQIIDEIFGKIAAGTAPHIRSITEAAVPVIIRHPRSSEMILWLTHKGLERMIEDAVGERGMHCSS